MDALLKLSLVPQVCERDFDCLPIGAFVDFLAAVFKQQRKSKVSFVRDQQAPGKQIARDFSQARVQHSLCRGGAGLSR